VRKIINFLDESGYDNSLRDKQLVVVGDEVFWMKQDWSDFGDNIPRTVKIADKRDTSVGQYVLLVIPPLTDIVNDIWESAKNSKIIDFKSFQQRAKALPA
jgi:hypothetical protein